MSCCCVSFFSDKHVYKKRTNLKNGRQEKGRKDLVVHPSELRELKLLLTFLGHPKS
jgi:hypothetical protein